jgi:hypothetical protein
MNVFIQALEKMPDDGLRLDNGLALRLTVGNGMMVLGCSRIDDGPSDEEMACIQDAVCVVFKPEILLRADTITIRHSGGYEHHIRRLYWPLEKVSMVQAQLQQQPFSI